MQRGRSVTISNGKRDDKIESFDEYLKRSKEKEQAQNIYQFYEDRTDEEEENGQIKQNEAIYIADVNEKQEDVVRVETVGSGSVKELETLREEDSVLEATGDIRRVIEEEKNDKI